MLEGFSCTCRRPAPHPTSRPNVVGTARRSDERERERTIREVEAWCAEYGLALQGTQIDLGWFAVLPMNKHRHIICSKTHLLGPRKRVVASLWSGVGGQNAAIKTLSQAAMLVVQE